MTVKRNEIYTGKANYHIPASEIGALETSKRTKKEIADAENEFCDKIWYVRHQVSKSKSPDGKKSEDPQICQVAEQTAQRIENQYGDVQEWFPHDDFELGYLTGVLSTLRWVGGDYWGFLDT